MDNNTCLHQENGHDTFIELPSGKYKCVKCGAEFKFSNDIEEIMNNIDVVITTINLLKSSTTDPQEAVDLITLESNVKDFKEKARKKFVDNIQLTNDYYATELFKSIGKCLNKDINSSDLDNLKQGYNCIKSKHDSAMEKFIKIVDPDNNDSDN